METAIALKALQYGVVIRTEGLHETGVPVSLAENPLSSVVLGTGKMLDDVKLLDRVCLENTVLHHN